MMSACVLWAGRPPNRYGVVGTCGGCPDRQNTARTASYTTTACCTPTASARRCRCRRSRKRWRCSAVCMPLRAKSRCRACSSASRCVEPHQKGRTLLLLSSYRIKLLQAALLLVQLHGDKRQLNHRVHAACLPEPGLWTNLGTLPVCLMLPSRSVMALARAGCPLSAMCASRR